MSLIQRRLVLNDDVSFDCYIFVVRKPDGSEENWFRGREFANFLGYKSTGSAVTRNVDPEYRCSWSSLIRANDDVPVPNNLQPSNVFISGLGLYTWVMRSTKPEAVQFKRWLLGADVRPSLVGQLFYEYVMDHRDAESLSEITSDSLRGHVYLATTGRYQAVNMYKIGFTANPEQRLSRLNAVRNSDDKFWYVCTWPTNDCRAAEQRVFDRLTEYRIEREFFRFTDDENAVDLIRHVIMPTE